MHDTAVITDTSCLIALTKAGVLDLLARMYSSVFVTEEIRAEFG